MPIPGYTLDTIDQFVGKELGVSDWLTVGQDRIGQFADATGDHQWIHVDAVFCRQAGGDERKRQTYRTGRSAHRHQDNGSESDRPESAIA